MDSLFAQLKKLHDNELFEQVLPIANILESKYDSDRSLLTPEQYFLTLVYNANSLFHQRQYRKADTVYRGALIARRTIVKTKPPTVMSINFENMVEMFPDHEIRYKIALCMEHTNNLAEALSILNTISNRQRTSKINMLIGRLSMQSGKNACAVTAYKMVVRECPMNLEAMKGLLSLNVSDIDICNIINESKSSLPLQIVDWITEWLEINTAMRKCQFSDAINKLEALRANSQFGKNELITVLLGQCYFYNGDYDLALKHLQRAHSNNYYLLEGLGTLSAIYTLKEDIEELEKLTRLFMQSSEYTTEHWLLFGQYYFVLRKFEKASYFVHKACHLNPRNVEAGLLKAQIFIETKKFKEAIVHLKSLIQFANYRFEVYDCLVTAYIGLQRWRDAHHLTVDACKLLGKSARIYVMAARAHLADPLTRIKAKPYLEKALKFDRFYEPAVLNLAELLIEDGNTTRALELLKKFAEVRPSADIFIRIGEIYTIRKDRMKSYEYFTQAVKMDPTNHKANAHLEALEKNTTNSTIIEGSIDQTAGASTSAENENTGEDVPMEIQPEGALRLASIEEEEGEPEGWADLIDVPTGASTSAENENIGEDMPIES